MTANVLRTVACVLALTVGACCACFAQTSAADRAEFEVAPTTVLTMAPNGSWGAATDDTKSVWRSRRRSP